MNNKYNFPCEGCISISICKQILENNTFSTRILALKKHCSMITEFDLSMYNKWFIFKKINFRDFNNYRDNLEAYITNYDK